MKKTVKEITRIYNSVAEFSAALSGPYNTKIFEKRCSETLPESFTGTPNLETANKLLEYGDAGSLEKIQAVRVRNNAGNGAEIRRRQVNSVVGYTPNVPNYLRGIPVSMIGQTRQRFQSSKVINIVYGAGAAYNIGPEQIASESSKLLSVINSIEKAGYRVGLSILYSRTNQDRSEREACIIKIKDAGQYMDVRKLAYILVNPSFQRRHLFRFTETVTEFSDPRWQDHYGYHVDKEYNKDLINRTPALKGSKYIGFYNLMNKTAEDVEKILLS